MKVIPIYYTEVVGDDMTNCRYERIIMIAIIVGVIGILGFSEYCIAQKEDKKDSYTSETVSKQEGMVTYQNVMVAKEVLTDLKKMSKCAGRDHIELLVQKGYQESGTDEEKSGLLIRFGSQDVEQNQVIQAWLEQHGWQYGFVQFQQEDYLLYRYTGRDIAKTIHEANVTFSEYLK